MGGKFAISFEFRSLAINFWIWGIKMFRLDLKIYLDRRITNRYILFIYWAKGGHTGGRVNKKNRLTRSLFIIYSPLFTTFNPPEFVQKWTTPNSYHTGIRGILRSLRSKRILSSQWDNRLALVSLPLFISNMNISLFFSSFRDIPKRRTVNIKAVEGTFWNLLSGTSYENFNAGGTSRFIS